MRRSLLFVPGHRPRMLDKAPARGADVVILDLEDAVPAADKPRALEEITRRLTGGALASVECWVRVNTLADAAALHAAGARPSCFLAPKVDGPDDATRWAGGLGVPSILSIEGPRGLLRALEIAEAGAAEGAIGLFFGAADFTAAVGCRPWPENDLAGPRAQVVYAARACDLEAFDAPHFDLSGHEESARSALLSRRLGFDGKAAIHPGQLAGIHAAFTPSEEEVSVARRIIAAYAARGTTTVDGQLVEALHARAARRVLALAKAASRRED